MEWCNFSSLASKLADVVKEPNSSQAKIPFAKEETNVKQGNVIDVTPRQSLPYTPQHITAFVLAPCHDINVYTSCLLLRECVQPHGSEHSGWFVMPEHADNGAELKNICILKTSKSIS